MKRLFCMTLALVLASSPAFAGPLGDAAAKAGRSLGAQANAGPAEPGHRAGGIFLMSAGAAFIGVGVWVFNQPVESSASNEAWRKRTGYLCVGAGAGFIVWAALKLRHPNAPQLQVDREGISVVQTVRF